MKTLGTLVALSLVASAAQAQQDACFHKVHHITCHFADGKTVAYDTDPNANYYNIPPFMTFRTADGSLHSIIGECESVCHP